MPDLNYIDHNSNNPLDNPYQQAYNDTCAIKSQQIILNDFGVPVTEDQLVQYSIDRGWYNGNGTAFGDIGKILVDAGIPCTQQDGANIYDLTNELAQGHKVIVTVDSGELWDNGILDWLKDIFMGETPDHALIVTDIDMSDPNDPKVILTDPGTGQSAEPYPLDQFMDAWGDSHNFMVSTDIPTPAAVEAFTENGMSEMHLPEVAGVDFDTFQDFHQYSHVIDDSMLPSLNDAFQMYPTMDTPNFDVLMNNFNLPYYDMSLIDPVAPLYDPLSFNYNDLNDPYWLSPIDTYTPDTSDITADSLETLEDLHQDALDHAQQCLDNGSYVSAQIWQNQALDIQCDIDNIILS